MRLSLTKLIIVAMPLSLFIFGCFDAPDDVVAPSWDLDMSIPVLNKTYTLLDAIKDNEDMIKWYPAGSQMANQLYYADSKSIEPVTIGDKVKIDNAVTSVISESIGEIKIQDPPAIQTSVDFSFDPAIKPGNTLPFPPVPNTSINVSLPQQDQYSYIMLSSGTLNVNFKNNIPSLVDLTLSGISLENQTAPVQIVGSLPSSITIPAGQTKSVSISLVPNVKINNKLVLKFNLSSPGSGLTPIQIPQTALTVDAMLNNLIVKEVNGKLKGNTITTNGSVQIDEQTKYSYIQIDKGSLRLAIKNNIDVGFSAKIRLNNLYNSSSSTTPFELPVRVERMSSTVITQPLDDFILKSNTPSSAISYQVLVSTDETSDYRVISSSNSYTDTIAISQLTVKSFSGIVKPTKLDVKQTSLSLDLKSLKDKFKFNRVSFKDPDVKIYMKPSSNFKVRFDGEISAKGTSNKLTFSDYISKSGSSVDSLIQIPSQKLADFLSSFSPSLPEELYISGSATVNPDYEQVPYTISNTDSVTGHAEVNFPLNVGIEDGQFVDTTDYDLKDNKEDIAKIKSVKLTVQISNGLAARVRYEGAILDSATGQKLLDLIPNRTPAYIEVPAAQVNSNGEVIAPSNFTEKIELTGSDIEKFLNGKYILSKVSISTAGAAAGSALQPVEFKITDAVKIKATGQIVYKVSDDK